MVVATKGGKSSPKEPWATGGSDSSSSEEESSCYESSFDKDKFINGVRYRCERVDKEAIPVPVFYAEDKDTSEPFESFIVRIEPVLENFGVGKIVPPPSWSPCATGGKAKGREIDRGDRTDILRARADDLVIDKAIKQHATGRKGIYRTFLVEQKPMNVGRDYKPLAEHPDKQVPRKAKSEASGDAQEAGDFDLEAMERHFWKNVTYQPPIYGADVEGSLFDDLPGSPGDDSTTTAGTAGPAKMWNIRNLNTILSKVLKRFIDGEEAKRRMRRKAKTAMAAPCPAPAPPERPSRSCKRRRQEESQEKIKNRRKRKEKTLNIPGVISPYLYFGMYRSFFAWHTEDVDLYSVNYLHFGAPKVWYAVPPKHRKRFESTMKTTVPELFMHCGQFLRHKELLASPMLLRSEQVPLVKFVQRENEWVINYPGAYHAGFNCGFNCAESTNFATEKWIEIGKQAKACECSKDSVRLDMKLFESYVTEKQRVEGAKTREVKEGETSGSESKDLDAPLVETVVDICTNAS